jgi:hypothetical protein
MNQVPPHDPRTTAVEFMVRQRDVVQWIAVTPGVLLICAAGLKVSAAVSAQSIAAFDYGFPAVEGALGAAYLWHRSAWVAISVLGLYGAFTSINLLLLARGDEYCGCLGYWSFSPGVMVGLDLLMIVLVVPRLTGTPYGARCAAFMVALGGFALGAAYLESLDSETRSDVVTASAGAPAPFVTSDPYPDLVVYYDPACGECQRALRQLQSARDEMELGDILIELIDISGSGTAPALEESVGLRLTSVSARADLGEPVPIVVTLKANGEIAARVELPLQSATLITAVAHARSLK